MFARRYSQETDHADQKLTSDGSTDMHLRPDQGAACENGRQYKNRQEQLKTLNLADTVLASLLCISGEISLVIPVPCIGVLTAGADVLT